MKFVCQSAGKYSSIMMELARVKVKDSLYRSDEVCIALKLTFRVPKDPSWGWLYISPSTVIPSGGRTLS